MVRAPNLSTVAYVPGTPPADAAEMRRFLFDELGKVAAALDALAAGHLDKTTVAPTKPRDGDIRYADGTHWNPGSGAGIYWFNGTTWTKL